MLQFKLPNISEESRMEPGMWSLASMLSEWMDEYIMSCILAIFINTVEC